LRDESERERLRVQTTTMKTYGEVLHALNGTKQDDELKSQVDEISSNWGKPVVLLEAYATDS
jgi:hypothetical protein